MTSGAGTATLTAGQVLYPGQYLVSANKAYFVILQLSDGNLCIYSGNPANLNAAQTNLGSFGVAQWGTYPGASCAYTESLGAAYLVMQTDGNLCMFNTNASPIWCSDTGVEVGQVAGFYASISNTGLFAIYN